MVYKKFDSLSFTFICFMVAFSVAAIVILMLGNLGPLRGNVTGAFSIVFRFVALVNVLGLTITVNYARSDGSFSLVISP